MTRYFKIYLMVVLGGLAVVAGINFAVDPYASFRWQDVRGFNDQKNLKHGGGRVNKSVILRQFPFDVLIFGSSTTENGINPTSPRFDGARVFNASLAFSNITELHNEAMYALPYQSPRQVIIGLDFFMFFTSQEGRGDYGQSLVAGASLSPILAKRLLSWEALRDSFGVVDSSLKHRPSRFPKGGNHDPSADTKHRTDYRERFIDSLSEKMGGGAYRDFKGNPQGIDLLRKVITAYEKNGAEVKLFVSPYHVLHKGVIVETGVMPLYGQWKRDVTQLIAEINKTAKHPVELWDFSDINAVTTDPLPINDTIPMTYYWDSFHYSQATGDKILARLFHQSDADPSFGTPLSVANLHEVINHDLNFILPPQFEPDMKIFKDALRSKTSAKDSSPEQASMVRSE